MKINDLKFINLIYSILMKFIMILPVLITDNNEAKKLYILIK